MSCPTCGHTTRKLNAATIHGDYTADYCPRCGTLVESDGPEDPRPPLVTVPALVGRCRQFAGKFGGYLEHPAFEGLWRRLGIAEAINPPGDRP